MQEWYLKWFGEDYIKLYGHRSDKEAAWQIDFIEKTLSLSSQQTILDIACGRGRHLVELRKRGYCSLGLDRSLVSLNIANKSLKEEGVSSTDFFDVLESDMRTIPFRNESFDILLSLFSSFGYFETDNEHLELLQEWRRVVKLNSFLFMDYLNKNFVLDNLKPESIENKDGRTVKQFRSISEDGTRINKKIEIHDKDTDKKCNLHKVFNESLRMYSFDELNDMLGKANFRTENHFGDFDGSCFTPESPRLLVVAKSI